MKFNIKNPLFILAAGLILVGASVAGGYTLAKETSSQSQTVQFETGEFKIDLQEKQKDSFVTVAGSRTEPGKLAFTDPRLAKVMSGLEEIEPGHAYTEDVKIVNNSDGNFPQYVKVVVRKRWVEKKTVDGKEVWQTDTSADANQIQLGINEAEGWKVIKGEPTAEESVYYLPTQIAKGEEKQLINSITVDNDAIVRTTDIQTIDGDEYVTIESYKDRAFEIKVRVDAVQARHTEEAMFGAWGEKVQFEADGTTIKSIDGTELVKPSDNH